MKISSAFTFCKYYFAVDLMAWMFSFHLYFFRPLALFAIIP